MAIRDIFKMIKADRYTQDGREELIKAQEAITEDIRYKPGDISKATGLQKQPDGSWKPVKNAPAQKKTDSKSDSGMSKHWVQKGDEADFVERTPEEEKKMWQGVASRQSDDKLMLAIKNREGRELKPVEKIKLEAAKEELAKRKGSASGSAPSTPQSTIIGNLSSEDKNKIYQLFNDADFRRQLDNKLEFGLDNQVGELILKKLPHGELKSKVYNLADQYNRENFSDAREYKSGLTEKAMGQLYKDYKEGKTSDSAPRILTGDCKVRIKKSK